MNQTLHNQTIFNEAASKYSTQSYWRDDEDILMNKYFTRGNIFVGGCGAGRTLQPLINKGLAVVGGDFSPAMVNICRAKYNTPIFELDIAKTPFPDKHFDNVFLPFHTICYTNDIWKTVIEMHRITKKGGTVIISAVNTYGITKLLKGNVKRDITLPVFRGSDQMLVTQTMSFQDAKKLRQLFKKVEVCGRSSLSYHSYSNWKDQLLRWIPFIDKSIYFICTK